MLTLTIEEITAVTYDWLDEQAQLANEFILDQLNNEGQLAPLTME